MKKTLNRIAFTFLLIAGVMSLATGCKKYEDGPGFSLATKKSRITGEWELKRIVGYTLSGTATWEFDKDGDFTETYNGSVYTGEWEFSGDKEELEIVYDTSFGPEYYRYEILRLTNKELNFLDADGDEWQWEKD